MNGLYSVICHDLGLKNDELISILETKRIYRQFQIKKRSGGTRMIYSPSSGAKVIQLWLASKVFKRFDISPNAYAYRKGCSVKKNVKNHQKNLYNFRFDLNNFFPTIKSDQFLKFLMNNKKSLPPVLQKDFEDLIKIVRKFCFLREGSLPQGFCSSPVISNILMSEIDQELESGLQKLSKEVVYTRYADDLTISFKDVSVRRDIQNLVHAFFASSKIRFTLNHKKERFGSSKAGSMFVNGIKICHDKHITVHRSYKDKVRRLFFAYDKGYLKEKDKRSLLGHLYYLRSIDPEYYNKLSRKYFNEIKALKYDLR